MSNDLEAAKANLGRIARHIQQEYPAAESFDISAMPGTSRYMISELTNDGYCHPHPMSHELGDSGSIDWDALDAMINQELDFDDFVGEILEVKDTVLWGAEA